MKNRKNKAKVIVKQKRYARPQSLFCGSCPHCLSFTWYGCERYYCLVNDEYKFNDYPEEKDCPFKEQNNGKNNKRNI